MSTLHFSLLYIALGSIVLAVLWTITLPSRKSLFSGKPRLTVLIHGAVNVAHVLSGMYFPLTLPWDIPIRSFGLTLFTIGMGVAIWAKLTMKSNWGAPAQHNIYQQSELVTTGPFAYSRNPIYVSLIVMSLGIAIASKSAFIFLVFVLYSFFLQCIQVEEHHLLQYFKAQYSKYCQAVPRFI